MKITKRQLKQIIREEKSRLLREADMGGGWNGQYGGMVEAGNQLISFLAYIMKERGYILDAETWSHIEAAINDVEYEAYQKGVYDGRKGHLT